MAKGRRRKQKQKQKQKRSDMTNGKTQEHSSEPQSKGANSGKDWSAVPVLDCTRETRRLAELVHREISHVLRENFGFPRSRAFNVESTIPAVAASAVCDRKAGRDQQETPGDGPADQRIKEAEALREENRLLRALLGEREGELHVARGRVAQLDACLTRGVRYNVGARGAAAGTRAGAGEAHVALEQLYRQYELRESHFAAIERASALETRLWQARYEQLLEHSALREEDLEGMQEAVERQRQRLQRVESESAESARILADVLGWQRRSLEQVRELSNCVRSQVSIECDEVEDLYRSMEAMAHKGGRGPAGHGRDLAVLKSTLQNFGHDLFSEMFKIKRQSDSQDGVCGCCYSDGECDEPPGSEDLLGGARQQVVVGSSARVIRIPRQRASLKRAAGVGPENHGGRDLAGPKSAPSTVQLPQMAEFTFSSPG